MTTENEIESVIARDRRTFIKKVMEGTIAGSLLLLIPATAAWPGKDHTPRDEAERGKARRFVFIVDITACIGCGSCCVADRVEYNVPEGRFRTWVERYVIEGEGKVSIDLLDAPHGGAEGHVESRATACRPMQEIFFVPKLCRMCEEPPCRAVCPTGATYRSRDGFVLIDSGRCIGCSSCVEACPHSARFLDPRTGTAVKCTWCYQRVRKGLPPVCVDTCPVQARKFGELSDKNSEIWKILHDSRLVPVEKTPANRPALYYLGWRREVGASNASIKPPPATSITR